MISKKLTHTHTAQQDRNKLGSRVVYEQRIVYGTQPWFLMLSDGWSAKDKLNSDAKEQQTSR